MADIYQQANEFRAALLSREREAEARLIRVYGQIYSRLLRQLTLLNKQIDDARERGETVNVGWLFRQERYNALLRQLDAEFGKWGTFATAQVTRGQEQGIESGVRDSSRLIEAGIKEAGLSTAFNRLSVASVQASIGFLADNTPLSALFARINAATAEDAKQALINSVAQGWGARRTAQELRSTLSIPLSRALTIARTETLRSYRTATQQTYQANADVLTGWYWTASKSRRTCLSCLSRDGQFYPLEKPFPPHPRCRCTLTPAIKGVDEPTRETGAQWFERQPDEVKREMMPLKAFEAYKAGRIRLSDFEGEKYHALWGPGTYQRSLREIEAEKPRAFAAGR